MARQQQAAHCCNCTIQSLPQVGNGHRPTRTCGSWPGRAAAAGWPPLQGAAAALAAGGWRRRRRGAPSPICTAEGWLLLRSSRTTSAGGWAALRKRFLGDSRALGAKRSAGAADTAYKLAGGGEREIGLPK